MTIPGFSLQVATGVLAVSGENPPNDYDLALLQGGQQVVLAQEGQFSVFRVADCSTVTTITVSDLDLAPENESRFNVSLCRIWR